MPDYFADDNPLMNKLGISDPQLLHEAEETIVANKTTQYDTKLHPKK